MYFQNRTAAGALLAKQLENYRFEKTAVVSLSPHGIEVGAAIAKVLRCELSLMITSKVTAQGEPSFVVGSMDQGGGFLTNDSVPAGEMEEYMQEMWQYVEEEKLHKLYEMIELITKDGTTDRSQLEATNVILTCEGVQTGMSIKAAVHYLQPVKVKKIIAAIPVGPASVLEQINQSVDELHYLFIPDNFLGIHHYYEESGEVDAQMVMASLKLASHGY